MRKWNRTSRLLAVAATAFVVMCSAACQEAPQTAESPALSTPSLLPPADTVVPPSPTEEQVETRETETPTVPALDAPPTTTEADQMVTLAKADLAQRLDVPEEAITVESVGAVQWPDASLGCPQPGMSYAQVITPGYRVVLAVEGHDHEYHTDLDRIVVPCADLSPPHLEAPGGSQLPIFVEILQTPLSPDPPSRMPPKDTSPIGVFSFNATDRLLLVQPSVKILPTTQVLVGLTTASVPGRPYFASEILQLPSQETAPLSLIAIDADTDTLTLTYADQVFELSPGESRSFKQKGEGELSPVDLATVTNLGRLAAIGLLPPDPGGP